MDFLKKLFEDKSLTWEEFKTLVDSSSDIKLANLKEGGYVGKEKFDSLEKERDGLREQIKERDKQLGELKKVDPESLKGQIETLENENKKAKENFEKELKEVKVNSIVEMALVGAGAKNIKAVKALLDLNTDELEVTSEGAIEGFEDKLKLIKENDSYLFEDKSKNIGGFASAKPESVTSEPIPQEPKTYADFLKVVENK